MPKQANRLQKHFKEVLDLCLLKSAKSQVPKILTFYSHLTTPSTQESTSQRRRRYHLHQAFQRVLRSPSQHESSNANGNRAKCPISTPDLKTQFSGHQSRFEF
jgi:hypothetical protein